VATVVNLDPDVEALLRRQVLERKLEFDRVLNEAVRAGLSGRRFVLPTYSLGVERVDLTKGLALADELEDEETVRKMKLAEGS
jgi:hypothetical protein